MSDPFELYLVRHAVAEERGEAWPDDTKRPLTAEGISRFRRAARGLATFGMSVDVILTSPLTRARQTADILAAALDARIVTSDALAPGGSHQAILGDLERHSKKAARIALVGHEPDIGQLAARLCGWRHPLVFKKGAVCRIDVDALPPGGPGQIRWFAPPRMLRSLRN